jgi:hypothetical protein
MLSTRNACDGNWLRCLSGEEEDTSTERCVYAKSDES